MKNSTEKAFLNCIINNGKLLDKASKVIVEDDLSDGMSRAIYKILIDEFKKSGNLDTNIISDLLPDAFQDYLEDSRLKLRESNFNLYMKKIKDRAIKKSLSDISEEVGENPEEDLEDVIERVGSRLNDLKGSMVQIHDDFNIGNAVNKCIEELESNMKNPGIKMPTGISFFDTITGGIKRKRLYVIGARTGNGKSSWCLSVAWNLVLRGLKVTYFSLEMSEEEMITRLLSMISGIDNRRLENPHQLQDNDWSNVVKAGNFIASKPGLIIHDRIMHVNNIELQIQKDESDIVMIDFAQHLKMNYKNVNSWHQSIYKATADLEEMAKKYNAAIFLASQLSRSVDNEKREPRLTDLKESGGLEENAHLVGFVHWPPRQSPLRNPETGLEWTSGEKRAAAFIVAKNRSGPTGRFVMKFIFENYRFEDLEPIG